MLACINNCRYIYIIIVTDFARTDTQSACLHPHTLLYMYQDWQAHLVGVVQRQPAVPRPVHPPPGRTQRVKRRDRPEHPESLTHSAASLRGKQYLPEDKCSYKDDLYLKAQLILTVVVCNV